MEALTSRLMEAFRHHGPTHFQPLPVLITEGSGCWVRDGQGRRYLDMIGCYSALNVGHGHPRLLDALAEQASRVALTSHALYNDQLPPLAEELCALSGLARMAPMNTGAEAVETAIKAARKWGYDIRGIPRDRAEIIVCRDGFHGRTITLVGLTDWPRCRDGFGPFTPGFVPVPYGDVGAIDKAIGPHTAAVLLEPVQAEAGVVFPPDGYLRDVRRLCDEQGLLLVLDEVQVGLGRLGTMFAFEHEGIQPDAVVLGKALGGGLLPISCVLARAGVLDVLGPGEHGSTFAGNPLVCRVARETLAVLVDEDLPQRAADLGAAFLGKLQEALGPPVVDVRGRGLLVGIQLDAGVTTARAAAERLAAEGLLCTTARGNVLRLTPPLVIDDEALDWALLRLERVLAVDASGPTPREGTSP